MKQKIKISVIKKNGCHEDFDYEKIIKAVKKASERVDTKLSKEILLSISKEVEKYVLDNYASNNKVIVVPVYELHPIVEKVLENYSKKTAKSYRDYRNYKKENNEMMEQILEEVETLNTEGDRSNANADSRLITTKRFLEGCSLSKASYQKFYLSNKEKQANNDGYIYIHDLSQRKFTMNCCVFDMKKVFEGGFHMGSIHYTEPKTLASAFNLLGDVILTASSQQYGGFTVPEIDKLLNPYANKSFNKYCKEYKEITAKERLITLKTKCGEKTFDIDNFVPYTFETVNTYHLGNSATSESKGIGWNGNINSWSASYNDECYTPIYGWNSDNRCSTSETNNRIEKNKITISKIEYSNGILKIKTSESRISETISNNYNSAGCASGGNFGFIDLEFSHEKTFDKGFNVVFHFNKDDDEKMKQYAFKKVKEEFKQGFQGIECMLNSCANAKGDYSFVSFTFGLGTSPFEKMASETCLEVRQEGQGMPGHKKPVLFPKLIFLYDKNLHNEDGILNDLFLKSVKCSTKCMYPDYFNVRQVEKETTDNYEKYNMPVSPMGCRSVISPFYESGNFKQQNEIDLPVTVGRWNIGVVSLNLIMIYMKAKEENKDFFKVLDEYLELIRNIHIKTKNQLSKLKASSYPLAFMEGGFWHGTLKADDIIEPLLKAATASFGITGLNELQLLHNRKSLVEDNAFTLKVVKYIYDKLQEFKNEDQIAYSIYGTPAESLSGKQILQFRKKYGIIERVSDRDYLSNSFHCHVSEDISPVKKQELENEFWKYFSGGRIMYNRFYNDTNFDAFISLIELAMEKGFYYGINLSKTYCEDCGYEFIELSSNCPKCNSENLTKIDRVCGYLGFSKINGSTRMNDSKMAEIKDRKSM